ncbi:MAG: hypothetical protein WA799_01315 [Nitrosotalea sp.]
MERLIVGILAVLVCCSVVAVTLWSTASGQILSSEKFPVPPTTGQPIISLSSLVKMQLPGNQLYQLSTGQKIPIGEWFTLPNGMGIPTGEMYDPIGPNAYYNYFTFFEGSKIVNDSRVISSLINDSYVYPSQNPRPSILFYHDNLHGSSYGIIWAKLWINPQSPPTRKIFAYATLSSTADPTGLPVILEASTPNSTLLTSVSYIQFSSQQNTDYSVYHAVLHVNPQDSVTLLFNYGGATEKEIFQVNTNDGQLRSGALGSNGTVSSGLGGTGYNFKSSLYGSNGISINCNAMGGDTESDGICDDWKPGGVPLQVTLNGVTYYGPQCGGAGQDLCPSQSTHDLYVVADAMGSTYQLSSSAISNLQTSFKGTNENTALLHGRLGTIFPKVQLHIQTEPSSESASSCPNGINFPGTSSVTPTSGTIPSGTCDFNAIKSYDLMVPGESISQFYQKAAVFHYALLTSIVSEDPGSSGLGEEYGNDMMVTLGASGFSPSTADQEGTFMHELGHNLGLYHGGVATDPNCKPNFLSVMNYLYQLPILDPNWFLDYSQSAISSLNNGPNYKGTSQTPTNIKPGSMTIVFGTPNISPGYNAITAGQQITSDSSGILNEFDTVTSPGTAIPECGGSNPVSSLNGFQDWSTSAMSYTFWNGPNYGMNGNDVKRMFDIRLDQIAIQFKTLGINNATDPTATSDLKNAKSQSDSFNFVGAISDLDKLQNRTTAQFTVTEYNSTEPVVASVINSYELVTGYTNIAFGSTYGAINSNATITVTDPNAVGNSVNVAVRSDTDQSGTQISLNRVNSTSDLFQGTLVLSPVTTVPGSQLHVSTGDTAYARYGTVFGTTMQVTTDHSPPPPMQVAITPSDFGFKTWPYPPITSTSAQYPQYLHFGLTVNQTVGPSFSPSSTSGHAGTPVTVSGSGFAPSLQLS